MFKVKFNCMLKNNCLFPSKYRACTNHENSIDSNDLLEFRSVEEFSFIIYCFSGGDSKLYFFFGDETIGDVACTDFFSNECRILH